MRESKERDGSTVPSDKENTASTASHSSERQSSRWDIANAPRNYAALLVSQFGSAAFSFAAVWLITRFLGSEGYGGIIAIVAASQVAQVLVNWTSVAVVRFGVDEFVDIHSIARTFWIRLVVLVVNLILVLLLAGLWFPPLAGWLKLSPETFWLVLTHFAVTVFWIHVQMSLQAAKMPRVQGVLLMLERLLILAGLLILIPAGRFEFFSVAVCYIASPAVMMFAGTFLLREYVFTRFSVDRSFLKKIFAYSVPLLPYSLVGYFSGAYIDAIFVSHYLSTRDLGIYSVATQMSGIALQLPTLANTLLLPLFVTLHKESDHQRTSNYFQNVLPGITLLWGLFCTGLSFISYFAIPIVFGYEFRDSVLPLWILLTASVVAVPVAIGYSALSNATSTTYISMYAAIFAAGANVLGNLLLIPSFGLAGSAWSTLFSFFVAVVVFALLLHRFAKIPLSWAPAAIVPNLAGAVTFAYSQNPVIGLSVCLSASVFVAYLFRSSLSSTWAFLQNFRANRALEP